MRKLVKIKIPLCFPSQPLHTFFILEVQSIAFCGSSWKLGCYNNLWLSGRRMNVEVLKLTLISSKTDGESI